MTYHCHRNETHERQREWMASDFKVLSLIRTERSSIEVNPSRNTIATVHRFVLPWHFQGLNVILFLLSSDSILFELSLRVGIISMQGNIPSTPSSLPRVSTFFDRDVFQIRLETRILHEVEQFAHKTRIFDTNTMSWHLSRSAYVSYGAMQVDNRIKTHSSYISQFWDDWSRC